MREALANRRKTALAEQLVVFARRRAAHQRLTPVSDYAEGSQRCVRPFHSLA
jgi:hypothetical protein